jgi:hypothetical protein
MPGLTPGFQIPYPLYTEPAAGAAQIQALAERVDDAVSLQQTTISSVLIRSAGSVSAVANQSIPNAAYTTVQWVTEDFDTSNIFNLGVSNTNATPTVAGFYMVTVEVRFAANATGSRGLRLATNAVVEQGSTTEVLAAAGGAQTHIVSTSLMSLVPGDVVTAQVLQGFRRFSLVQLNN